LRTEGSLLKSLNMTFSRAIPLYEFGSSFRPLPLCSSNIPSGPAALLFFPFMISSEVAEVQFPSLHVYEGARSFLFYKEVHGGVVVSFASLRNNLRRTMASREVFPNCDIFHIHFSVTSTVRLARSPKESRALPNSSMMTSVTIVRVLSVQSVTLRGCSWGMDSCCPLPLGAKKTITSDYYPLRPISVTSSLLRCFSTFSRGCIGADDSSSLLIDIGTSFRSMDGWECSSSPVSCSLRNCRDRSGSPCHGVPSPHAFHRTVKPSGIHNVPIATVKYHSLQYPNLLAVMRPVKHSDSSPFLVKEKSRFPYN
ncbi:hypothetical protein L9F63_020082, partial [Diploptera punctata]